MVDFEKGYSHLTGNEMEAYRQFAMEHPNGGTVEDFVKVYERMLNFSPGPEVIAHLRIERGLVSGQDIIKDRDYPERVERAYKFLQLECGY